MATAVSGATPKHLWVVGILSLLWNCFGAFDYTMTELEGTGYLQGMGFSPEEIAYFTSFPAWAVALWAIGVWSSVAGSILLFGISMRHRDHEHADRLSLLPMADDDPDPTPKETHGNAHPHV